MKKLLLVTIIFVLSNTLQAQWNYYGELENPRSSTSAVAKDNKIYVVGGFEKIGTITQKSTTMDVIDEEAGIITKVNLPGSEPRVWPAIVAGNKGVYMISGAGASGLSYRAHRYESDSWLEIDNIPEPTFLASAVKVGNKLIVAGGHMGNYSTFSNRIYVYDEDKEEWSTETLSVARFWYGLATDGNKVYFAGGFDDPGSDRVSKVIDIWDVANNTWTIDSLSIGRANVCGGFVDGKIIFAGGHYSGTSNSSPVVDIFDGTKWTATSSLSQPRGSIRSAVLANKLYLIGGGDWDSNKGDVIKSYANYDIYDSKMDTWTSGLTAQDRLLSGIAATQKAVYAAGGLVFKNGSSSYTNQIEVYAPFTGIGENSSTSNISVYPNPSEGKIWLKGLIQNTQYQIYDQLGRFIIMGTITPFDNQLDLSELESGHYYLRIEDRMEVIIIQ